MVRSADPGPVYLAYTGEGGVRRMTPAPDGGFTTSGDHLLAAPAAACSFALQSTNYKLRKPPVAQYRVMLQMPYTPGIASVFDNHPEIAVDIFTETSEANIVQHVGNYDAAILGVAPAVAMASWIT
jgi:hypothetical protein